MESPAAIARYFLEKSEEGLTPMQLNKLVYIAHGWHLGLDDEPLIDEDVQAWKYGPVIKSLYHKFKTFGKSVVPWFHASVLPQPELDPNTERLLDRVWEKYGHLSGPHLSTITHQKDTPWFETWNKLGGRNQHGAVIPNEVIERYYKQLAHV